MPYTLPVPAHSYPPGLFSRRRRSPCCCPLLLSRVCSRLVGCVIVSCCVVSVSRECLTSQCDEVHVPKGGRGRGATQHTQPEGKEQVTHTRKEKQGRQRGR